MRFTIRNGRRIVLFAFFVLFQLFLWTNYSSAASDEVKMIRLSTGESLLNKAISLGDTSTDIGYKLKGIEEKSHTFSSSDSNVFSVSETGGSVKLESKKEGLAKLTLTVNAKNGNKYTDSAYISIYSPFDEVDAITTARTLTTRSPRTGTENLNERGYVPKGTNLKVCGQCKGYYRINWKNNTFDDGLGHGNGYIAKSDISIPVVGLELAAEEISLAESTTKKVEAKITPAEATNKKLSWKTNNATVANVDGNGIISSEKQGTAIITVSTNNGITKNIIVSVYRAMNSVEGRVVSDAIMSIGAYEDQYGEVLPKYSKVAVLGECGDYYYVTINGKNRYIKKNQIEIPVKEIVLNSNYLEMMKRDCFQLSAVIKPAEATGKEIVWKSSKPSVADITRDGKVVARGEGECVVIAENSVNGVKSECKIVVNGKNDAVPFAIEMEKDTLEVGDEMKLIPNDTNVEWYTSDKSVLTVNKQGVITAITPGEATITGIANSIIGGVRKTERRSVKVKVFVEKLMKTVKIRWEGGKKDFYIPQKYKSKKYKWKVKRHSKELKVKKKKGAGNKKIKTTIPKKKTAYGEIHLCLVKVYSNSTGKHIADVTVRVKQGWHPKSHYRALVNRLVKTCGSFGLKHTREFLKRSAKDKPKHYKKGAGSKIAKTIKKSHEYNRLIRRIKNIIRKSKKTVISGGCKDDRNREFGFNDIDLLLSIQHYDYKWKAKKKKKKWEVFITLTDTYDFAIIDKDMYKKFALYKKAIYKAVIIPATNFALKATKCGAINPYNITINIKDNF